MKCNVRLKLYTITCTERVGIAWKCFSTAGDAGLSVDRIVANRIHPFYVVTMLLSGRDECFVRFEAEGLAVLAAHSVSIADVEGTRASVLLDNEPAEPLLSISVYAFDTNKLMGDTAGVIRRYANAAGIAGATYSAAESGAPLFLAEFKVRLLAGASRDDLERDLMALADERGWDIRVQPYHAPSDHRRGFEQEYPPSRGSLDLEVRGGLTNPN